MDDKNNSKNLSDVEPVGGNPSMDSGSDLPPSAPRSLQELIDRVSGRSFQPKFTEEDSGLAEILPFPFLALVGQKDMKLALILILINPMIGGVLLIGPRGTGKTTSARSLTDLLPEVPRSLCYYGCMPEDIEAAGIDAVCPDCAKKFGQGQPIAKMDRVRLVELPLNARIEEVVGGIDERSALHDRMRIRRGLLSQADRNILYVDEVNLLGNDIVDAILDAAAQGSYTVRRGPVSATYNSRFTLIGSMNPEEGHLRPQILDRFGLRIMVRGLDEPDERLEAYRRVQSYLTTPRHTVSNFAGETAILQAEIQLAREILPKVEIPDDTAQIGLGIIRNLKIDSLRAEITLFETARAYSAADGRTEVTSDDLSAVAILALRARRSSFMTDYLAAQQVEEAEIESAINSLQTSKQEKRQE